MSGKRGSLTLGISVNWRSNLASRDVESEKPPEGALQRLLVPLCGTPPANPGRINI